MADHIQQARHRNTSIVFRLLRAYKTTGMYRDLVSHIQYTALKTLTFTCIRRTHGDM